MRQPFRGSLGIADKNGAGLKVIIGPARPHGFTDPPPSGEHIEGEGLYYRAGVDTEGVDPFQRDRRLDLLINLEAAPEWGSTSPARRNG